MLTDQISSALSVVGTVLQAYKAWADSKQTKEDKLDFFINLKGVLKEVSFWKDIEKSFSELRYQKLEEFEERKSDNSPQIESGKMEEYGKELQKNWRPVDNYYEKNIADKLIPEVKERKKEASREFLSEDVVGDLGETVPPQIERSIEQVQRRYRDDLPQDSSFDHILQFDDLMKERRNTLPDFSGKNFNPKTRKMKDKINVYILSHANEIILNLIEIHNTYYMQVVEG